MFKDCDFKLGYIGHSSNGSYATTSSPAGSTFDVFKFDGARLNNLCAIYTPPYPVVENLKTCPSNTVDLANALLSTTPAGYTLQWWTTPYRTPGTQVADPTKAGVGTYYAFFVRDVDDCPNVEGIEMKVSYYTSADAAYVDCGCELPPNTQPATDFTLTGISNLVGFANGWPGNVPNGFIAIESKNKGFVITRVANTNAITNPIEGMLIYDISAPCVKLYTVIGPGVTLGWKCLEKLCE